MALALDDPPWDSLAKCINEGTMRARRLSEMGRGKYYIPRPRAHSRRPGTLSRIYLLDSEASAVSRLSHAKISSPGRAPGRWKLKIGGNAEREEATWG